MSKLASVEITKIHNVITSLSYTSSLVLFFFVIEIMFLFQKQTILNCPSILEKTNDFSTFRRNNNIKVHKLPTSKTSCDQTSTAIFPVKNKTWDEIKAPFSLLRQYVFTHFHQTAISHTCILEPLTADFVERKTYCSAHDRTSAEIHLRVC